MGTHPIFESDFDCLTETGYKMTKGTTSRGTRNDKTHIISRISGRRVYHLQKKRDSVRGRFNWSKKAKRRTAPGTGRARHLKDVNRRFHNGFREGTQPRLSRRLSKISPVIGPNSATNCEIKTPELK